MSPSPNHHYTPKLKNPKPHSSTPSIFHLQQSEHTTIAKQNLLQHTHSNISHNLKFYSINNLSTNTHKTHSYWEGIESYQSWHGEKATLCPDRIQNMGMDVVGERGRLSTRDSSASLPSRGHRRYMLRSANASTIRRSQACRESGIDQFRRSYIDINSNNLSALPIASSLKELKCNIGTKKHGARNSHSHFSKNEDKKNNQSGIFKSVHFEQYHQQKSKDNKINGLSSIFKRKSQKKGNWLLTNNKPTLKRRIDQFKPTNSPLNSQINKIIQLLNSQSIFNSTPHLQQIQ